MKNVTDANTEYAQTTTKHSNSQTVCKISWNVTLLWRHNGHSSVSNHSLTIVYATVYSDADQSKHQTSASLAFVRGIHRGPVNSPHKGPVTRKMFPFDDVIMKHMLVVLNYFVTDLNKVQVLSTTSFVRNGECILERFRYK